MVGSDSVSCRNFAFSAIAMFAQNQMLCGVMQGYYGSAMQL